jgi:hypothetical protein
MAQGVWSKEQVWADFTPPTEIVTAASMEAWFSTHPALTLEEIKYGVHRLQGQPVPVMQVDFAHRNDGAHAYAVFRQVGGTNDKYKASYLRCPRGTRTINAFPFLANRRTEVLPGRQTSQAELESLGFSPLSIKPGSFVTLPNGTGRKWDTEGTIPEAQGHYVFTVEDSNAIWVAYAGMTEHLWMVTKGRLPRNGGSRPGNRYGRPRYARETRRRINIRITEQLACGRRATHWVRPWPNTAPSTLGAEEEVLICRWHLRDVGWNIG